MSVVILCNGKELSQSLQLKAAKDLYWPFEDKLLTLYYKRRDFEYPESSNTSFNNTSLTNLNIFQDEKLRKQTMKNRCVEYQPRKPPIWVPKHLAFNCFHCEQEFDWFFTHIHHCRNCGRCFCSSCSNTFLPIKEFGYFLPVRVCVNCKPFIEYSICSDAKRPNKP